MKFTLVAGALLICASVHAQQWTFQSGGQTNNGSVQIKSIDGASSQAITQNPTGAAARANQSAVTQAPMVIMQASAKLPVVVEGTACNSATDQVGIDAAQTKLFTCASGVWTNVATPLAGYQIVSATVSSSGHFEAYAYCPAPKKVVGGGCYDSAASNRALVRNNPISTNGWQCRSRDINTGQYTSLTAYAICLSP